MLDSTSKAEGLAETKKLSSDMDTWYYCFLTAARQFRPNKTFVNLNWTNLLPDLIMMHLSKLPSIEIPNFYGSL